MSWCRSTRSMTRRPSRSGLRSGLRLRVLALCSVALGALGAQSAAAAPAPGWPACEAPSPRAPDSALRLTLLGSLIWNSVFVLSM